MTDTLTPEQVRFRERQQAALELAITRAENNFDTRTSLILRNAWRQLVEHGNSKYFETIGALKRVPVTIEEFLASRDFLAEQVELWPSLQDDIRAINPDILAGETPVYEYLDGGATGTGKTTKALVTQCYQLYVLSCFQDPQTFFGLSRSTPIVVALMSVQERITRRIIYQPLRDMFTAMPFTKRFVRWDKYVDSALMLEKNIQVVPILATVQNMVGQAIIGGLLDEVNFMSVVENSRTVFGERGLGGLYDQADVAHGTMTRRRKSRFTSRGPVPGTIAVLSSTRYKSDFLDRRMAQVKKDNEPNVLCFRRKQYEVQPSERYCGETIRVLIGTDNFPTRILEEHEEEGKHFARGATVENVPIEYKFEFLRNPESALRDVVGISTDVIAPFLTQRHKIVESFIRAREQGLKPWCEKMDVELGIDGMPKIVGDNLPRNKDDRRFVHVDLSISKDRCGIAICRVAGHTSVMGEGGVVEVLPHVVVEAAITIKPNSNNEIDIAEVRQWVLRLKEVWGINIYSVTYDGFQSRESIQVLRKAGVRTGEVSMDRTTEPYNNLRDMFYTDRLDMLEHEIAKVELTQLEKNAKTGKVDHPPKGSKDVADAICGAVYSAVNARAVRATTGVTNEGGKPLSNRVERMRRRDPVRR